MLVFVRDNNVDQALKALKKKMQREGVFREMKRRKAYEKPSEKTAREKGEAIRRSRKAARKLAQREGLLPMPKRKLPHRRRAALSSGFRTKTRRRRAKCTSSRSARGCASSAANVERGAAGIYKVVAQLPDEKGDQQYRIQSAASPRERVAKESQLQPAAAL